jgi:hypothetical protein
MPQHFMTELGEFDIIALGAFKTSQGVWKWTRDRNSTISKSQFGIEPASIPGTGGCLGFDKNGTLATL